MISRRRSRFASVTAALVAGDLASKAWAGRALGDGPIVLPGPLDLQLDYNDGIAFGFFDRLPAVALIAASLLIAALLVRAWDAGHAPAVPTSMIVAGAVGNGIDRLESGSVVDMLHLGWWPTFNVADVYITTGVALWIVLAIWPTTPGSRVHEDRSTGTDLFDRSTAP